MPADKYPSIFLRHMPEAIVYLSLVYHGKNPVGFVFLCSTRGHARCRQWCVWVNVKPACRLTGWHLFMLNAQVVRRLNKAIYWTNIYAVNKF